MVDPGSGKKIEPTLKAIKIDTATNTSIISILKTIGYINDEDGDNSKACRIDEYVKEAISELGPNFTEMLHDLKDMTLCSLKNKCSFLVLF